MFPAALETAIFVSSQKYLALVLEQFYKNMYESKSEIENWQNYHMCHVVEVLNSDWILNNKTGSNALNNSG